MHQGILLAILALMIACSPEASEPEVDGTWVGTITTEGNVTTVVNETGSVWGGTATLVEEASIGVDVGLDEQMFGSVSGLWASDDRIFVADVQIPAVRVYDLDGNYIQDIGRPGQGPGEYTSPGSIYGTRDGRLFLMDDHNSKVHVFTVEGQYLETWPARNVPFWPGAVAEDGTLWLPLTVHDGPGPEDFRRGIQAHGPEGAYGPLHMLTDVDFDPVTAVLRDSDREIVPFAPRVSWAPAGPASFVVGAGDRYRFEVQREGRTVLVVEKSWTPIPISGDYAEWARQLTVAQYQRVEPGWSWDGSEMPGHLPAFSSLEPTQSGQVWVKRRASSTRQDECVENPLAEGAVAARENPCWVVQWAPPDVFDEEGRFLGSVEPPPGVELSLSAFYIEGDMVLDVVLDEAGTIMVKRYRLVLPGEEGR